MHSEAGEDLAPGLCESGGSGIKSGLAGFPALWSPLGWSHIDIDVISSAHPVSYAQGNPTSRGYCSALLHLRGMCGHSQRLHTHCNAWAGLQGPACLWVGT